MLCHGELVLLRPNARHLTLFYLLVALGGAFMTSFASIVAPAFFGGMWELQVGVVAAWLLVMAAWWVDRESPVHSGDRWLFVGLVAIVFILWLRSLSGFLPLAESAWVASHSWASTVAATAVGTLTVCAIAWTRRMALAPYWPKALLFVLIILSSVLTLQSIAKTSVGSLYADRNFYGAIRVVSTPATGGEARQLNHC